LATHTANQLSESADIAAGEVAAIGQSVEDETRRAALQTPDGVVIDAGADAEAEAETGGDGDADGVEQDTVVEALQCTNV
jgi:hypothetical protein